MLKKIIFVGGTSFSGSTMLDMMLSNDPCGFSCGEIVNLFYPTRPHHVNPWCGCGNPRCCVWRDLYAAGPRGVYSRISELLPDVSFIVDSSKNSCWIRQQEKVARAQGIEVSHVLIWKSPSTLARSFEKRGRMAEFEPTYVNYHRLYDRRVDSWTGVQYEQIVDDDDALAQLCTILGIRIFGDKREFWGKQHHTLFGNNSAKVSLFSPEHPRFQVIKQQRVEIEGERAAPVVQHRSIYRDLQASRKDKFAEMGVNWNRLAKIEAALRSRSVPLIGPLGVKNGESLPLPRASSVESGLRCLAYAARRSVLGMRYRQHFSQGPLAGAVR